MTEPLYKYVSLSTAEIVLRNCTLRWTTPSKLNDPFDTQTALNLVIDETRLTTTTLQKMWEIFNTPVGSGEGIALLALRHAGIKMSRHKFEAEAFGLALWTL